MNDFDTWARELTDFLETATRTTEVWADQAIQGAVDTANAFVDEVEKQLRPTLEQWADELGQSLEPLESALDQEIERFSEEFTEFINPIFIPLASALESWAEAVATPISSHVDPVINDHPACMGCRHYHGHAYGGNMLVCAMYPYGPEAETCPDWESC
ncbi:MAG: hypothetical protein ACFBSG_21190 [Leptolyngbyaceae cyanobacterium]